MRLNSGASRLAQASRPIVRARALSISSGVAVDAAGYITSQVRGTRFSGSSLMSPCSSVVPVRGRPMMNTGASTRCACTAGLRARSASSCSRFSSRLTISSRTVKRPSIVRFASRRYESSNRSNGPSNRPLAEVGKARAADCRFAQRLRIERGWIGAEPAQRSAADVQRGDCAADAALRKAHRWSI